MNGMKSVLAVSLFAVSLLCISACATEVRAQSSPDTMADTTLDGFQTPFDDNWRFHKVDLFSSVPDALWDQNSRKYPDDAALLKYSDSSWRKIDLPHDWCYDDLPTQKVTPTDIMTGPFWWNGTHANAWDPIGGPAGSLGGTYGHMVGGVGWYRKTFQVPAAMRGKKIHIFFDGVYKNCDVWLNGVHLGHHGYGWSPFGLDLTPALRETGPNVLAVKVNCTGPDGEHAYRGAGINRHVVLQAMGPVHVTPWGPFISTRSIAADSAVIRIQTDVQNENHGPTACEITTSIIDKHGKQVKEISVQRTVPGDATASVDQECALAQPLLWDLDSPNLYEALTTVTVQGQKSHEMPSTFGIRTISADAVHGLRLNGKTIKLTGTGFGGENACVGTASFYRAECRKLEITKAYGFNTFRVENCAPSAAFLDACDNVGMLVPYPFYEYPIVRWYPWPDGTEPGWQRDVAAMIQRTRNHPSVIMYLPEVMDYGWHNYEVRGPKPIATRANFIRSQDPTRFVCRNFLFSKDKQENDINWPDPDENGEQVDIIGSFNGYHDRHPSAVMFNWDGANPGSLISWKNDIAHSWFIGGTTGVNGLSWQYRGEDGWPGTLCGMGPGGFQFDFCGFPYANAYLNRIVYKILSHKNTNPDLVILVRTPFRDDTGDFEEIPSWTWPAFDKAKLNATVYSSCDKVRLLLNGRDLGTKSENFEVPEAYGNQGRAAQWSIPYEAGTLKAIGFIGGVQVAEDTLPSAAKAASIRLSPDRPVINADNQDLCHVTVEVTDASGIWTPFPLLDRSPDASHPQFGQEHLHFAIDGPGSIVGIENALKYDHESLRKPEHDTHLGRCLVAIRSSHTFGTITLKASGDGLTNGKVTIISK